jgi:hypothetical protein
VLVFGILTLATACLVLGCLYTVQETRLAMVGLREEQTLMRLDTRVPSEPPADAGAFARPTARGMHP